MDKPKAPPPNRDVRSPNFVVPKGSIDCHFHIIGPQTFYPLAPTAPVALEDSTLADYLAVQSKLGLSRGVIITSFGHGFDYQHLLHAMAQEPSRFKAVTMLAPDVTDTEIAMLSDAGVVGARFFAGYPPTAHMLARLAEIGWSAHLLMSPPLEEAWRPLLDGFAGKLVLEHSGLPAIEEGIQGAYFKRVLRYLDGGRCWVKLSPRFGQTELPPFEDTIPFNRALVDHCAERLLYGSDYPHPNYWHPMPNEAEFLELLPLWAPDEIDRLKILVRNPEALFGFSANG